MPRVRWPRRGSRAYSPRKRAKSIVGRVDHWPEVEGPPQLLGFAGYKAGMTHTFMVEDRKNTPDYGKEVMTPVTVIEAPPMLVCALRAYVKESEGLKPLTEAWMDNPPENLRRRIKPLTGVGGSQQLEMMRRELDRISELRLLLATQPWLTGIGKKKPEAMEVKIGGGKIEEQFEYAKGLLGKSVRASDVLKAGESVDVIGVTKGKGFQGPVKRFGVRILQDKARKTKRGVATLGPWHPARVMPGVPRAGQMGFHHRTEYNKRILLVGEGDKINPPGGFIRYGLVKNDYIVVKGSVMGPEKRLIRLRKAVRRAKAPEEAPTVTYVHSTFLAGGGSS
jgi:large subunit ribosomal protein L3